LGRLLNPTKVVEHPSLLHYASCIGEVICFCDNYNANGGCEMTMINSQITTQPDRNQWIRIGLVAAVTSILAVLMTQWLAIAIWPDIVLFKPLDSYPRTAIFTAIPTAVATALFAWLAAYKPQPVQTFLKISVVVLLLSFIPDYLLPVPHKTVLASSVAAFMHLVAAAVIVTVLVVGYRQKIE
jgi:hypothetical protein